jgi:hypothetical protein
MKKFSKYEKKSNLNKNTKSEQKRKTKKRKSEERKREEKDKREERQKKEIRKRKRKFADGPGPNTPGCVGGARRGAKRTANGRQIGIPRFRRCGGRTKQQQQQ